MAINYHPKMGTIVICDFHGFIKPEMTKRRPAIVVSPRFRRRGNLCTVVPLSTTAPNPIKAYHYKLTLDKPLPRPYNSPFHWVKGDILATVSFNRLYLPYEGKNIKGKRKYIVKVVEDADLYNIRKCVLRSIGLFHLTKHL
jgi:mRNA interferase MazF